MILYDWSSYSLGSSEPFRITDDNSICFEILPEFSYKDFYKVEWSYL